ncbi:MAG: hypothetical protein Kow0096_15720 [Thiohalomonadaceae bacterium]
MVLRILAVVLGVAMVAQAAADTLDVNLHGDALRATYSRPVGATRGLDMDVGLLHVEENGYDANVIHAGLQVAGMNWSKQGNFNISLGGRAVFADVEEFEGGHVAFGGSVRFSPMPRVGFGGSLYYAPNITSFLDAEEYTEWGLFADYQLLTQAYVYVGYRNVEVDAENGGSAELDDHVHIGMRMNF